MTHITCRLTAKNWDQLRNPTLRPQFTSLEDAVDDEVTNFTHLRTCNLCPLGLVHSVGWQVSRNVGRILVRGVSAPLPPEAKKILKI